MEENIAESHADHRVKTLSQGFTEDGVVVKPDPQRPPAEHERQGAPAQDSQQEDHAQPQEVGQQRDGQAHDPDPFGDQIEPQQAGEKPAA